MLPTVRDRRTAIPGNDQPRSPEDLSHHRPLFLWNLSYALHLHLAGVSGVGYSAYVGSLDCAIGHARSGSIPSLSRPGGTYDSHGGKDRS